MQLMAILGALWASQRRFLIACSVLLLLNLILLAVLMSVVSPHVAQVEREFLTLQETLRAGQSPGENLTVEARYHLSTQALEQVFERIPPSEELSGLVGELYRISRGAGLEITKVQYAPKPEEHLGLLRYSLDFDVTGGYRQLKLFVHELEQSDRLVILDSISLARLRNDSAEVAMRLKFTTFFRRGGA